MSSVTAASKVRKRISDRQKYITYEEAFIRYGLGETTIRKMAKDCDALYKIGRAARIKVEVFDEYFVSTPFQICKFSPAEKCCF